MEQKRIKSQADLLSRSLDAIDGDTKNSAAVTLAYNNAAIIKLARNAAIEASNTYGQAVTDWEKEQRALKEQLREARVLAAIARDLLKPRLGNAWSRKWIETGFTKSLQIPRSPAPLSILLQALSNYYKKNPTYESPSSGVTAALLKSFSKSFETLRQKVRSGSASLLVLVRERREKFIVLRNILRALARELTQKLGPLDERWNDYGFLRPGAQATPPAPEQLSATIVDGKTLLADWKRTPRADYYRVFWRVAGTDGDMTPLATVGNSEFATQDLPTTEPMELAVSAVNSGGESALSKPIIVSDREVTKDVETPKAGSAAGKTDGSHKNES